MANLRVEVQPDHKPEVTRLAHHKLAITAHTWRTYVQIVMKEDGSADVSVRRDGTAVHSFSLLPEAK